MNVQISGSEGQIDLAAVSVEPSVIQKAMYCKDNAKATVIYGTFYHE